MIKGLQTTVIFMAFTYAGYCQELISAEQVGSITKEELNVITDAFPEYGVDLYRVRYTTTDLNNEIDTASGLVVVPKSDASLNWPLLSYSHGTVSEKDNVPSNLRGGYQFALAFAGRGYVTAAADFLGLGDSKGLHPYLHAETEASATIDLLFATRSFAQQNAISLNEQLFITGYSQGGHVAMATHQVIQEQYSDEFMVTAAAPMSGPYSISLAFRDLLLSDDTYDYPFYIVYTTISYNLAYNWGYEIEELFKMPYSEKIRKAFGGETELSTLNDDLFKQLLREVGMHIPKEMFQDSIIDVVINQPNHPINMAIRANDTFNWSPEAPTRLYYCKADDQVGYQNSVIADSILNLNGATDLQSIDVDSDADHNECVIPAGLNTIFFFAGFKEITVSNDNYPVVANALNVRPNPTKGWITFDLPIHSKQLQLYDPTGKLLLTKEFENNEELSSLDLSHLPNGIYYFKLLQENQIFTETIFKQ